MTNAWSLLYDEMTEHSSYYYDYDRNREPSMNDDLIMGDDPLDKFAQDAYEGMQIGAATTVAGADSEDVLSFDFDLSGLGTPPSNKFQYKYNEEEIVKELLEYIRGTYNQHYSSGDDQIQTLDLIEACGDGEPFCRSNILKYASRYDKKGTARRDIMKILHYAVLLLHFNDKNAQREDYPQ